MSIQTGIALAKSYLSQLGDVRNSTPYLPLFLLRISPDIVGHNPGGDTDLHVSHQ